MSCLITSFQSFDEAKASWDNPRSPDVFHRPRFWFVIVASEDALVPLLEMLGRGFLPQLEER